MSHRILDEQMFSMNDIADALSMTADTIRGISKQELLRIFVSCMQRKKPYQKYATVPSYRPDDYLYYNQPDVRDFWRDIEDALFGAPKTTPSQSKSKPFLHIKSAVDVGMYGEGDETFYVLFTKNGDLEFDTWEAAQKHLNDIATKARWVTENERPKLSGIPWADDDEDEELPSTISTILPQGTVSTMLGATNGLLPMTITNKTFLTKISNLP